MERQFPMSAAPFASFVSAGRSPAQSRGRQSFTLVELLVVMAIIAILMALAIPALSSLFEGDNLNPGAQELADQVNLARQLSSTRNITVEMRVFKMSGAPTGGYTAVQTGTYSSTGLWQTTSRLSRLPQNIVIAEATNFSSAFAAFSGVPSTMTNAGMTSNALYHPFEFRPSGIVTPVQVMTNYCFLVMPARYATQTTLTGVKNFAIVQINPVTGTPMVFRP